jgi:hypothetical protein
MTFKVRTITTINGGDTKTIDTATTIEGVQLNGTLVVNDVLTVTGGTITISSGDTVSARDALIIDTLAVEGRLELTGGELGYPSQLANKYPSTYPRS